MSDLPTRSTASPAPAEDRTAAVIVADYLRLLLGHDRPERVKLDPERLTDYAALAWR